MMNCPSLPVLVHLGAGVGNVVLATPLLAALQQMELLVDVWLSADYPETIDLLRPWSAVREVFTENSIATSFSGYAHVLPAIPPFYWARFAPVFAGVKNLVKRPPPSIFYENEQAFYLHFARALGFRADHGVCCTLPIAPTDSGQITRHTVVLAPGCKTGVMAAKRWPHFPKLAEAFDDVAIVGTRDDLKRPDGTMIRFQTHVRSFVDKLTLRQTAEHMAAAGVVLANDSGLGHVAAAVGAPTILLFGPTPHRTLGRFPPNVSLLRRGLSCEPCWFKAQFAACSRRISCLEELTVAQVLQALENKCLGISPSRCPEPTVVNQP